MLRFNLFHSALIHQPAAQFLEIHGYIEFFHHLRLGLTQYDLEYLLTGGGIVAGNESGSSMSFEELVNLNGEAMAVLDEVPYQPVVYAVPKEWLESWMALLENHLSAEDSAKPRLLW